MTFVFLNTVRSDRDIRSKFRPHLGPVSSTLEGTILLNIAESSEGAVLNLSANPGTFNEVIAGQATVFIEDHLISFFECNREGNAV